MRRKIKRLAKMTGAAALALAVSVPTMAAAENFEDVPWDIWYCDYVNYAAEKGLFTGVTEERFEPDRSITRGEFITVVSRLHEILTGEEVKSEGTMTFEDVPEDMYYAEPILWGQSQGIVRGYTEKQFCPEDVISREAMATMIARYLEFAEITFAEPVDWFCSVDPDQPGIEAEAYMDYEDISDWAAEGVDLLSGYRIMVGNPENHDLFRPQQFSFRPQNQVTRAEVAAVVTRIYQGIVYQEETETMSVKIPFNYVEDWDNQRFILDGKECEVISDYETFLAVMERVAEFAPDYAGVELTESYFAEKNLLAVEIQEIGCPLGANEVRLTKTEILGDTAFVTFFTDAHGSTADISGNLILIEVPKTVTGGEVVCDRFVHDFEYWEG